MQCVDKRNKEKTFRITLVAISFNDDTCLCENKIFDFSNMTTHPFLFEYPQIILNICEWIILQICEFWVASKNSVIQHLTFCQLYNSSNALNSWILIEYAQLSSFCLEIYYNKIDIVPFVIMNSPNHLKIFLRTWHTTTLVHIDTLIIT